MFVQKMFLKYRESKVEKEEKKGCVFVFQESMYLIIHTFTKRTASASVPFQTHTHTSIFDRQTSLYRLIKTEIHIYMHIHSCIYMMMIIDVC